MCLLFVYFNAKKKTTVWIPRVFRLNFLLVNSVFDSLICVQECVCVRVCVWLLASCLLASASHPHSSPDCSAKTQSAVKPRPPQRGNQVPSLPTDRLLFCSTPTLNNIVFVPAGFTANKPNLSLMDTVCNVFPLSGTVRGMKNIHGRQSCPKGLHESQSKTRHL